MLATGQLLRGGKSALKTFPADLSLPPQQVAAAVRVPGFLPQDRYDEQPLWSRDRTELFVCQARLDNREDLLRLLAIDNADTADSTLLHAAWLRWQEQTPSFLAGDYAFAAYSTFTKTLFAAVDHLAHSRLYYAARGNRISLCTQLAALRQQESAQLDETNLALSVEARYLPGATPFRNIHQLSGGESLRWRAGTVRTQRWWQPSSSIVFRKPHEYLEAAEEVFTTAVRSCLRSASPVHATLSGGLDSGLVTSVSATLLRSRGEPLIAYTASPATGNAVATRAGWDPDDTAFAAKTAALHPNLQHIVLRSNGRVALDLLDALETRSAVPVRNGANHLWLDDIATHLGSGALLTGARGNFSISYGGSGAFAELLRASQWRAALHCARQIHATQGKPLWKILASGLLPQRIFELLRARIYDENGKPLQLTTPDFRRLHQPQLNPPARPIPGTRTYFASKVSQAIDVWAADPIPQWGIEWRDPTADRRLLELLLSFPLAAFTHAGHTRGLARHLGRNHLPHSIRFRRTQGQQAADYATAMAAQLSRYCSIAQQMQASPACRSLLNLTALDASLTSVANGELSGAITSPIDRCIAAGTFLLKHEVS